MAVEVDHVVSFSLWKQKLSGGMPTGITDEEEALAWANRLGNCALLEKNFNISKSDHGLKYFLSAIHEVVHGKIRIDEWCAALGIPKPLLDPDSVTVDSVKEAIDIRDQEIREDVAQFVRGHVGRADVDTPGIEEVSGPEEFTVVPVDISENPEIESEEASAHAETTSDSDDSDPGSDSANPNRAGIDIVEFRTAYRDDTDLRLVIEHFADRENNQRITAVDTLVGALNRAKTPLSRPAVVRVFRSLDALGIGRFIPGRKGHVSRFQWYEKSLSVRGLALSQPTDDTHAEVATV